MLATPVVKGKFWIIKDDAGEQVGTIQNTTDGTKNVVLVQDKKRTRYPSIKALAEKANISIVTAKQESVARLLNPDTVYGYPVDSEYFNQMYNVQKGLPVYTKTEDSKSFFCAGYYIVNFNGNWVKQYCPKLLTLDRNKFRGPFYSEDEMKSELEKARKK